MSMFIEPQKANPLDYFLQAYAPRMQQKQNMLQQLVLLQEKQKLESQGVQDILNKFTQPQATGGGLGAIPGATPPQAGGNGLEGMTQPPTQATDLAPQAIMALEASANPTAQRLGKSLRTQQEFQSKEAYQQQKLQQQAELQRQQHAFKQNEPYFADIEKKRTGLDTKELAIMQIQDALSQGDTTTIKNFLAARMPNEEQAAFIRAASAQQLKDATKTFFLEDLKEIPKGGRLNVVLEQNILGALQSPGKTLANNQKITEYQIYKNDVTKRELEAYDYLYNKYLEANKEPPANFKGQVDKMIEPYLKERKKELAQSIMDIDKGKLKSPQILNMPIAKEKIKDIPPQPGFTWLMDPKGNPALIPNNKIPDAIQAGGMLIK